jgi:hypothetical protein
MAKATPQHLTDLFEIANGANTAELFRVARAVAEGTIATAVIKEAPTFLPALFPTLSDADHSRIGLVMAWAMHVQNVHTIRELSKNRKIAQLLNPTIKPEDTVE